MVLMIKVLIFVYHLLLLLLTLAREKPHLLRLSTVRILPFATVDKKKAMRGGALTFQILSQGNELCSPDYNIL